MFFNCDLQDIEQGKSPYFSLLIDFYQIHLPGDPSSRQQCCCCYHCGVSPAKGQKEILGKEKIGGGGWGDIITTEC